MSQQRPSLELTSITLAAPDPRALAQFYAALLGVQIVALEPPGPGEPKEAGWAQVKTANLTLNFEYARKWRRPSWPYEPAFQSATQYLVIQVAHPEAFEAAVAWATACGAQTADSQPQRNLRFMLDPAGHPFCLCL